MAGLGSFVQGLGGGLMQGQNMALQREQLQMRKDAGEAQKAQQKQELAFKTFDLGMKLSGTDMPDSMRKKGIGMIGEAWKTLNPNSDLSFLDNMDMNNTEAKKAFKLLNTNYDKLQSGDLKMDEFQQIVRGIGQDLYGAQKKSFMEDAKALTDAKKAQADSEKLTKGTAFANKDNQRVVPMYDAQGGFKENQVLGEERGKTSSSIGKLITERDALPPGDPNRKTYDSKIAKEISQSNMVIESDGKGGFRMTQGPGAIGAMGKATQNKVEGKLFDVKESLARLDEIGRGYKPEFLQLDTRVNALVTKWQEKGKGTPIASLLGGASKEDKQALSEYASFKRESISNINLYIKEITGAQMSEKEADRIRLGMPDPGEGIFDGDSPTEFESKWKSTVNSGRLAQARYVTLLKQGLTEAQATQAINSDKAPSLDDLSSQINSEGELLKNQGMGKSAILNALNKKFFSMD